MLPTDYLERVYAGVLGKIIGVYLGRPFEGWSYEAIMENLGEINYYVHDKLNMPLIVTDDDICGTFTFIRALEDYGITRDITPAQIGHTWLNYIIEEQTIFWWGGMGNSTEHTAYLRLKAGIEAPRSGSIALNGKVVAEQIGAQIFIDGWGLVAPGDPELAADFARKAGSVSHDGEAIYGAQVIAAMEAQAFVERDLNKLIDTAVALIPKDSVIAYMINDIREWHAKEPDWRAARQQLAERYGYDKYGGNCHMVPNHGLILFSLLYGDDDFQKSLMIVNTSGWDTDCNSGNVGCLLGIKNGLATIDQGPDWRSPVADRLYLPTADGGRSISDAVAETYHLVNMGRALQGQAPLQPKGGARFHFDLPGSVQGFVSEDSAAVRGIVTLENVAGFSESGSRSLAIHCQGLAAGRVARIETPTFIPSREIARSFEKRGYRLLASPTLYSGQTVRARVVAADANSDTLTVSLYAKHFNGTDDLSSLQSDPRELTPGQSAVLTWRVPDTHCYPIAQIGVQVTGNGGQAGTVLLDYLTWDGAPDVVLDRPAERELNRTTGTPGPMLWKAAWIDGFDSRERLVDLDYWPESYRLIQNRGRGLLMQGTREWTDYQVTARLTPHMCQTGGIGVRAQGMTRYYALLLDQEKTRLVRAFEGQDSVLAEIPGGWKFGHTYELNLKVQGNRLTASINGQVVLTAADPDAAYSGGGIALISEVGRIGCEHVEVRPLS
ncbi:MAG: ADP-ribosylglycohydrolase family protein [Chloroflexi bacterium]|uniref:ADP-ribosylglycohydrolase family protein n=1 Tax=Candidatus Flexifilum breve TaxID=3140694 RepID=UPI003136EF86|nr:ADP-ribosylglycohydrolase family protein [Chloroflexota bacterium]